MPAALQLLAPLPRAGALARVMLSGGVSQYVSGREREGHDDLGRELAEALIARRDKLPAPLEVVPQSGVVPVIVKSLVFPEGR